MLGSALQKPTYIGYTDLVLFIYYSRNIREVFLCLNPENDDNDAKMRIIAFSFNNSNDKNLI